MEPYEKDNEGSNGRGLWENKGWSGKAKRNLVVAAGSSSGN